MKACNRGKLREGRGRLSAYHVLVSSYHTISRESGSDEQPAPCWLEPPGCWRCACVAVTPPPPPPFCSGAAVCRIVATSHRFRRGRHWCYSLLVFRTDPITLFVVLHLVHVCRGSCSFSPCLCEAFYFVFLICSSSGVPGLCCYLALLVFRR
ncbi:unnamed protein product [Ectocarpus sp. 13 AM-2016]